MSTDTPVRANRSNAAGSKPTARPLPTRERRPAMIGLAVLLVVGFGLGGMKLLDARAAKTAVLMAAHEVPAGHVLVRDDLATVEIAGGIRAILASNINTAVGYTTAVDLTKGQILNKDMLTQDSVPKSGQALVGLSLKPQQLPAFGVMPGDKVNLIVVPATPADALDEAVILSTGATVFGVKTDESSNGNVLISVLVAEGEANKLVTYSSVGRVGLVKVAG